MPRTWSATHRLHFPYPHEGQLDVMCVANPVNGGRDGFTHADQWPDGNAEFSVTDGGDWRREGHPLVGWVEVL
jgi:hypothetical protein